MRLDSVSSRRLEILRFPLIVGVVFIHAYEIDPGLAVQSVDAIRIDGIASLIRDLISQELARVAVPLFFLMSGFLFFYGRKWSLGTYREKLASRAGTLLIPFIFWNGALLLLIAMAQASPVTQAFFSGKNLSVSEFGIYDYLNAIFGLDRKPVAYQFWFIRDLMALVVLSPVVYFLVRWRPILALSFVAALWLLGLWPLPFPSVSASLFFMVGAACAVHSLDLFRLDKYGRIICLLYAALVAMCLIWRGSSGYNLLHDISVLFGSASALYVSGCMARSTWVSAWLAKAAAASFFVFAAHEPLLTVFRKLFFKYLRPESEVDILIFYFSVPLIVISICLVLYLLLRKSMPRFLGLITGGR